MAVMKKSVMKRAAAPTKKTDGKKPKASAASTSGLEEAVKEEKPVAVEEEKEEKSEMDNEDAEDDAEDVDQEQDASSDEDDEEEQDEGDADDQDADDPEDAKLIKQALEKKHPKTKMDLKNRISSGKKEDYKNRATLYIGHLPNGFFEPQLKDFFQQFGNVTRYQLIRAKKSGRSRGYAFVEFELKEVAEIVQKTMHNYLLFGRKLDIQMCPSLPGGQKDGHKVWRKAAGFFQPVAKQQLAKQREQMNPEKREITVTTTSSSKQEEEKKVTVFTTRQQERARKKLEKLAMLKDYGISTPVASTVQKTLMENTEKLAKAKMAATEMAKKLNAEAAKGDTKKKTDSTKADTKKETASTKENKKAVSASKTTAAATKKVVKSAVKTKKSSAMKKKAASK
ncbi:unnamed protein product [Amoebophrya sp. A25]|nr:unnamed protein product [Amoebophrya sp. A25]|eukprot:GSA25T00010318001.1